MICFENRPKSAWEWNIRLSSTGSLVILSASKCERTEGWNSGVVSRGVVS